VAAGHACNGQHHVKDVITAGDRDTTIGASKESNIQLRASTSRAEFVHRRTERDAKLAPPRLLFPSVQVNVDAGRLPRPHANGMRYLTIPLDMRQKTDDDGTPV
jgi:hypothetical protein